MQFYLKVGKILLKGFASILFRSEIKYRASHFCRLFSLFCATLKYSVLKADTFTAPIFYARV